MPITPTVFRPIRANDFQQRNFKAYKNYRIISTGFATSSGYVHHQGLYDKLPINVGDDTYDYPVNTLDGTNKHVIWHSLNHRYYAHPYDAARSAELTNPSDTTKNLYESASALIAPYFEVGERIKPGSVTATFSTPVSYTLHDDGKGNLRDSLINTSSFASASRNIFYMSFNKEFESGGPVQTKYNVPAGYFSYEGIQPANRPNLADAKMYSGYAFHMDNTSNKTNQRIRIPHEEKFNRFNVNDDWTISFWYRGAYLNTYPIISKAGIREESYFDVKDSVVKTRDNVRSMPSITESYANTRTPFVIGHHGIRNSLNIGSGSFHFHSSNGSKELHISSSTDDYHLFGSGGVSNWVNVVIRNNTADNQCQIFIDGKASGTSGSIPPGITANRDDIILGAFVSGSQTFSNSENDLAELRIYDYAASESEIESLANNDFLSGSLFQTNVAGNVFYRNGELVVSSPMLKYNSGSGAFGNVFDVTYKGTHTIYENEVLVRVPKDQFNVSMNPTATYTPATDKIVDAKDESKLLSGELQQSLFVSGTLKPYITTIGLYNDAAQLIAVSKLAQPIQKRDDVDMNFIVRWDY